MKICNFNAIHRGYWIFILSTRRLLTSLAFWIDPPSSRCRQAPCPFYGACLNLETAVILFLPPFSSVIYRRVCPSRRAFLENYSDCSPLFFFFKNEPPWRIGHFVYRKAKKGASCVFLSDLKGVDNYTYLHIDWLHSTIESKIQEITCKWLHCWIMIVEEIYIHILCLSNLRQDKNVYFWDAANQPSSKGLVMYLNSYFIYVVEITLLLL